MTDESEDAATVQAGLRLGQTLKERWRLDDLLGVGGMAAVYAATHRNGKRVAVKVLHAELSSNALVRERFLREGYVANSVNHPGAVSVDDDDVTDDGCAFLVMELLDGETLDARWERKGRRLPVDEVLALMDQVLETLSAGHATGVVHRDLKPENLFLTRTGVVKVLDFGIARVRHASATTSKTQTGSTMGTPAFMPPEQARGRWDDVDPRTDLWAVGATMFTLLTGEYVHMADTVNEALALAITARARPISAVRPDLPREVAALIDRALSYEQEQRFSNATAMQQELRVAYLALRERPTSETGQPATGSSSYAVPALTLPSSTLGDIPSSAVPSSPRQRHTTNRGLGATLLGTFARSPRYVAFGLAIAAALVVATTTYFKLRRPAEAETVPDAQTIAHSTALAPSSPFATSSQVAPSATPVPVLEINDIPATPAADSILEKAPATNRRAGASSSAASRVGAPPAAARVSPKPFDPFAVRE